MARAMWIRLRCNTCWVLLQELFHLHSIKHLHWGHSRCLLLLLQQNVQIRDLCIYIENVEAPWGLAKELGWHVIRYIVLSHIAEETALAHRDILGYVRLC